MLVRHVAIDDMHVTTYRILDHAIKKKITINVMIDKNIKRFILKSDTALRANLVNIYYKTFKPAKDRLDARGVAMPQCSLCYR